MSQLSDLLSLIYNPMFIIGVTRLYKIFDSLTWSRDKFLDEVLSAKFHVPLVCCIFSIAAVALSHEANKKFTAQNPDQTSSSLIGVLTFASAGAILLMFYFVVDLERFPWWLGSYGLLCLVNAAWNFLAMSAQTRVRYVWTNILIPLGIVAFLVFFAASLQRVWPIYLLLLIVSAVKFWQRAKQREFKVQKAN